jgi:hypothetical protein
MNAKFVRIEVLVLNGFGLDHGRRKVEACIDNKRVIE